MAVAALAVMGAMLGTVFGAPLAGAQPSPGPAAATTDVDATALRGATVAAGDGFARIDLQAVSCSAFSSVPANAKVAAELDQTGGGYLQWGPPLPGVVSPLRGAALPATCQPLPGVGFWLSSSVNGSDLQAAMAGRGGRASALTSLVPGQTGADGILAVDVAALPATKRGAIATTGLWVAASGWPGRFANLQCHNDRYNADNLEVIRAYVATPVLACVLYVVDVPKPTPPVVGPSPTVPPPAPAPAPAGPSSPAPPSSTALSVPATGTTGAAGPAPAASVTTTSAPTTTSTSAAVAAEQTATGSANAPGAQAAAAARATRFVLRVEVSGVTLSLGQGESAAAQSPWRSPLRAQYRCGQETRLVELAPPRPPGFSMLSEPLAVPAGVTFCTISVLSGGEQGNGLRVRLDQRGMVVGEEAAVALRGGDDTVATLSFAYDTPDLSRPVTQLGPASDAPEEALAPPAALRPSSPSGGGLTPEAAVGLASVFAAGLGLSIVAARRGRYA